MLRAFAASCFAPAICAFAILTLHAAEPGRAWVGPAALCLSRDGAQLYVATHQEGAVQVIDLPAKRLSARFSLAGKPTGIAWSEPGRLLVTMTEPDRLVVLDSATGRMVRALETRSQLCAPVSGVPGRAFVCSRYEKAVLRVDLRTLQTGSQGKVWREPVAAALAPDGQILAVANLLPSGRASERVVRSVVSLLEPRSLRVLGDVPLPNGSTAVRAVAFHPAKPLCAVVHNVARFQVPATQVEHGWMNVSALSLINAGEGRLAATVLLDDPMQGAANPSAVGWSADGLQLCVAHAGTHELSVLDAPALEEKLRERPEGSMAEDYNFLKGIRTRVRLPGNGPRAIAIRGSVAYVAEYFSDSVAVVDLRSGAVLDRIALGPGAEADPAGAGERLFDDATICHQNWQSCASCHFEGRVDGLNWDLLNDGIGNPKNTRSLLLAHQTPPAMSSGVRASAEQAVRSGVRHILFAVRPKVEISNIFEYVRSLQRVRSPYLADGELSRPARSGKRLFEDPSVGCAQCHPPPLFTDRKAYALGPEAGRRGPPRKLDTPTLLECWRTAPYLHDGSAATIREVLTSGNPGDRHGRTSHLSEREVEALVAYVLSL